MREAAALASPARMLERLLSLGNAWYVLPRSEVLQDNGPIEKRSANNDKPTRMQLVRTHSFFGELKHLGVGMHLYFKDLLFLAGIFFVMGTASFSERSSQCLLLTHPPHSDLTNPSQAIC